MTFVRPGVAISHRDRLPSSCRYELLVKIASGGMATVYVGRLTSAVGIHRLVAIKRAHAHLLEDPAFSRMLIAEAKLASRIHHPNVVAVHNVEEIEGELLLVMDYVEGASLADLVEAPESAASPADEPPLPTRVVTRVLLDACAGLHAAHKLADDDGRPLGLVHRDVSPHNILVGVDGVARLTDFGIAKSSSPTTADGRTSTGALKGKVAYMAPEYVESATLDARSDVFSLGVVAWEALTRRRLFRGASEVETLRLVLEARVPRASSVAPWLGAALDPVLEKALARAPADRFATAADLGEALEVAARGSDRLGKHADVATWVKRAAEGALAKRRALVRGGAGEPTPAEGAPVVARSAATSTDVRAREGATSPAIDPPERAAALDPPGSGQTFGSGVSAQLVREAREARTSSRRRIAGLILGIAAAIGGVAGVTAMFAVPSRPPPREAPPTETVAAAAPPPASTPPSESPPSPPPPASASASAPVVAATPRPRARPHESAKPAPPKPTGPSGIVTALPPDPEKPAQSDRAPPNPYAR